MKSNLYRSLLKDLFFKAKDTKWIVLMTAVVITMVSVVYAVGGNVAYSYASAVAGSGQYDCILRELSEDEYEKFGKRETYGDRIQYFCTATAPIELSLADSDFYFSVSGLEGDWKELEGISLSEGAEAVKENEIVLDKNVSELTGTEYRIGDSIQLQYYMKNKQMKTKEFVISGFLDAPRNSGYELAAMVSVECGYSICKEMYGKCPYMVMLKAAEDTDESVMQLFSVLANEFGLGERVVANEKRMTLLFDMENNSSGMILVFRYLGVFISIVSFAVLYNMIHIAMNDNVKKVGLYRSLGMDREQLVAAFVLCLVLYAVFGTALAFGFYAILEYAFGQGVVQRFAGSFNKDIRMVWELDFNAFFVSSLLVLAIFAVGYLFFAIKVCRLTPAGAVSYSENDGKVHVCKKEKPEKKLLSFLGKRNLRRNKTRAVYTGFTLCLMAVLLMTVINVFCNVRLYDVSGLKKSSSFDFEFYGDQKEAFLDWKCVENIGGLSAVDSYCWGRKRVHEFFQTREAVEGENNLVETRIYSDGLMEMLCADNGMEYDGTKPVCFLLDMSEHKNSESALHLYDADGKVRDFTINGVIHEDSYSDGYITDGITLVFNEPMGKEVFGDYGYNLLLVKGKDSSCYGQVKELLENSGYRMYYNNLADSSGEALEQLGSIIMVAVYLLICIGIMVAVNMVCSISINIRLRMREYGIMQALGMERTDALRLIIYEILSIAKPALYIAVTVSLAVSMFLVTSVNDDVNYIGLAAIPILTAVCLYGVIFVFCYCIGRKKYKRNVAAVMREE